MVVDEDSEDIRGCCFIFREAPAGHLFKRERFLKASRFLSMGPYVAPTFESPSLVFVPIPFTSVSIER